jgi:hypothetical protein
LSIVSTEEELRRSYDEAARDAFEEGKAVLAEAVKKAEARRRFHVFSDGRTVIAYDLPHEEVER